MGAESLRSSKRDSVWGSPAPSIDSRPTSPNTSGFPIVDYQDFIQPDLKDAVPMTRLQIIMAREVFGWPLYTIIIGLGQMISATSYQITLLTGKNYQSNTNLYILGGFFLAGSLIWYPLFRFRPSIYVLGLPWFCFSIAFFLIGLPSASSKILPEHLVIAEVATWFYSIASAAAFAFFGLNFGEEAGAATEVWTLRACIVQGSQQLWVAGLWYWGNTLDNVVASYVPSWYICLAVWPLSAFSLLFGILMLYGLPDYYRQAPPKVHHLLTSLFRRKLVIWFLISEVLRDYWLSGPYGRNWTFLWSTSIPKWQVLLLILTFFIGVWTVMLLVLTHFSKTHTWLLPVFAVGLGAPRWCQILWGTSSIALYLPWGGESGGPYVALSLWLWLGVLDAIQGVGLGMILLQTLSRLHVCVTLVFAQVLGTVVTMVARATSPDRLGPSTVFPDTSTWAFSDGLGSSMIAQPYFWIALICQLIIVVGYFVFYRSEQLARP